MGRHNAPEDTAEATSAEVADVTARPAEASLSAVPASNPTDGDTAASETSTNRPTLRVVRGDPTPDELAVVAAVVAAATRDGGQSSGRAEVPPRNRWADPFDFHQRPWLHGVGGWRTSLRP